MTDQGMIVAGWLTSPCATQPLVPCFKQLCHFSTTHPQQTLDRTKTPENHNTKNSLPIPDQKIKALIPLGSLRAHNRFIPKTTLPFSVNKPETAHLQSPHRLSKLPIWQKSWALSSAPSVYPAHSR